MSEPNSGSDLASINTNAKRDNDGWVVNGQKIWTTYAQKCHYMIALVRTSGSVKDRHDGLSQLIINLRDPGITISPIRNMIGDKEFNEVKFDNVFVSDSMLVGEAFEQLIPEIAHDLINVAPNILHGSDYEKSLAYIQQACVSFSLRGGTTEILRSVIARGLGLR